MATSTPAIRVVARREPARAPLLTVLSLLCLAAAIGSLAVGSAHVAPGALMRSLAPGGDHVLRAILLELRLPRLLLSLLVGGMLGLAGASLQGYLRNPLADPAVLGLSNSAALGAAIALYFGLAKTWPVVLPLLSVGGALAALAPLLWLTRAADGPLKLVLAGVAVGSLAGAGVSLALNLSPNPFAAMEISGWLLGSLADRDMAQVWIAAPCILVGGALLLADGRALDALSLGEDTAESLGIDRRAVRVRLLLGTAVGVGGAVAVSGAIAFVGLVTPHLVRPWTDRRPSASLVPSALAGAALLTAADVLVRLVDTPTELKLGVVTSIVGVPVFVFSLSRNRRLW